MRDLLNKLKLLESMNANEVMAWYNKYEDEQSWDSYGLADGFFKYFLDSGIPTDAMERSEVQALIKKFGEEEVFDDPLGAMEKAPELAPITNAMFKEFKKIAGPDFGDEEVSQASRMLDNVDEGMREGSDSEVDAFFTKVAAAGSDGYDMLYDANSGKYGDAVNKAVSDMYNDVSVDNGLHGDDDHEEIYDRMMDQIEADYGTKEDYTATEGFDDSDEQTFEGEEFFEYYGYLPWHEDVPVDEAEYQGRKVQLGKPMRGDVKKFKVYVRDPKTKNVKKVNFGDPNMKIKKSNPKRRKSFRARHNCDNPGPRTKARYWSCRKW